jgi:hypothetical protein
MTRIKRIIYMDSQCTCVRVWLDWFFWAQVLTVFTLSLKSSSFFILCSCLFHWFTHLLIPLQHCNTQLFIHCFTKFSPVTNILTSTAAGHRLPLDVAQCFVSISAFRDRTFTCPCLAPLKTSWKSLGCCWIQSITAFVWVTTMYGPFQLSCSLGDFPMYWLGW